MIAAKSCDFHLFAYIRFFSTLSKKKKDNYNFRALCGIPITQTGLCRLIRTFCFYSGFLPCVFLCVKTGLYRLLTLQTKILEGRKLHYFKLENQFISTTCLTN